MELLEDKDHFIIRNGEHSLWCSRIDGSLTARRSDDIFHAENPICLGLVYGVIGKLRISPDTDWRLLVIKQQSRVGELPGNKTVHKIVKILVITLGPSSVKDWDIDPCAKHNSKQSNPSNNTGGQQKPLQRTWNQFKMAAENIKPKKLGFKIPPFSDLVTSSGGQCQKDTKEKEKFERRVLEELGKMFNDSESFYYCPDGDITNTIQRQQTIDPETPFWQRADDRFFWNKYMLQDLINSKSEMCRPWLIPIIQGYVQIETCPLTFEDEFETISNQDPTSSELYKLQFKLSLVSRRSRYRAGTRYKRRGVDEDGNTANYVETEQILEFTSHIVSFVQVRGSVPLYWGQTGIKYKPPPRIYRDEEQNHKAFTQHFEDQLRLYKAVTSISLVDQLGKEKVISDAFLRHVITHNSPQMTYVAFDFHEYCRGMRFENVSILTENVMDIIQSMGYCWVDQNGTICEQHGIFRVNCIDCLDRTNIVQSALARIVLEIQCRKLGLLSPERPLAPNYRTIYQQMWANNGDIISCQYAGTAALKGDYTRTGERRLAGMMKDGVNSANRYYINRVKDVYRQATVDLTLGNPVVEDFEVLTGNKLDMTDDTEVLIEKEENLKTLIDECKKMLITEPDECLGGWGLINCDHMEPDLDPSQQDMDIILLLSQKAYYVAHYDDDTDHVTSYQKISLNDLDKIEIGLISIGKHRQMCVRIFYKRTTDDGYFHTFCTTSTRLFNNIVVGIRNQEEAKESLRAICETFLAAKKLIGQELEIVDYKLDKNKTSKEHVDLIDIASEAQVQVESSVRPKTNMSRDSTSENLKLASLPLTHETAVSRLIHLTGNSSAKLTTLGRAMVGMFPAKKMRMNRLKIVPNVLYRRENVAGKREGSDAAVTDAGKDAVDALKDGSGSTDVRLHLRMVASNVDGGTEDEERLRVYSDLLSSSDSELSNSDLDLSMQGHDSHFMLRSSGVLMASPQQVIVTLLKGNDIRSKGHNEVTDGITGSDMTDVVEGVLERKKAAFLAQAKSRSLDVEERLTRAKRSEEEVKAGSEQQPQGQRSSTTEELLRHDIIRKKISNEKVPNEKRRGVRNDSTPNARRISDECEPEKDLIDFCVIDGDDGSKDVVERCPAIVLNDREIPSQPPPLLRRTSLLKLSHSEGSLSASLAASQENVMIDLDDLDFFDTEALRQGGSALNKLRVKMANLALPTMTSTSVVNRRQQLREHAKNNLRRSQLRFKECKTRIILL